MAQIETKNSIKNPYVMHASHFEVVLPGNERKKLYGRNFDLGGANDNGQPLVLSVVTDPREDGLFNAPVARENTAFVIQGKVHGLEIGGQSLHRPLIAFEGEPVTKIIVAEVGSAKVNPGYMLEANDAGKVTASGNLERPTTLALGHAARVEVEGKVKILRGEIETLVLPSDTQGIILGKDVKVRQVLLSPTVSIDGIMDEKPVIWTTYNDKGKLISIAQDALVQKRVVVGYNNEEILTIEGEGVQAVYLANASLEITHRINQLHLLGNTRVTTPGYHKNVDPQIYIAELHTQTSDNRLNGYPAQEWKAEGKEPVVLPTSEFPQPRAKSTVVKGNGPLVNTLTGRKSTNNGSNRTEFTGFVAPARQTTDLQGLPDDADLPYKVLKKALPVLGIVTAAAVAGGVLLSPSATESTVKPSDKKTVLIGDEPTLHIEVPQKPHEQVPPLELVVPRVSLYEVGEIPAGQEWKYAQLRITQITGEKKPTKGLINVIMRMNREIQSTHPGMVLTEKSLKSLYEIYQTNPNKFIAINSQDGRLSEAQIDALNRPIINDILKMLEEQEKVGSGENVIFTPKNKNNKEMTKAQKAIKAYGKDLAKRKQRTFV